MFDKLKSWILGIGGALIAFLALIAGARKKKIKKLEKEAEAKDAIIEEKEIAVDAEREQAEKTLETKSETEKTIEAVRKDEKGYNDIISDWNNRT